MSIGIIGALLGFFGVLCGAISTYVVALRKMSGRVSSTEATDLWAEARNLREDAAHQIKRLEDKIAVLEEKVSNLIKEKYELLSAKFKYEDEVRRLSMLNEELVQEIAHLRRVIMDYEEERRKEKS